MRSSTWRLEDLKTTIFNLGFVGENEHKQLRIDCKEMFGEYPTASPSLTVCPPAGDSYPAVIERDGDFVIWTITDSDLIHEGSGEIQLSFTVSEVVAKSYIGRFRVSRSIVPTGEIPSGIDDFLTRAGAALTAIPETIDEALAEAKASGEFDGPAGPAGQDGTDGQDGYSPTATVTKSGKVATITITDKNGTTTAQISDGESGGGGTSDYSDLTNKPQINDVTLSGNVSLHDLGAAAESDIPDPTSIIDDTAGDGDTNKVWSADKSYDLLSEINNRMLSDDVKSALMLLAEKVAYSDDQGPVVYSTMAGALYDAWPVINNLSHCTSSNSSHTVAKNGSYSATITAAEDYTLTGATVMITMGGVDITSTAYSSGTISIASVTGVLSISITAQETASGYVTDGLVAYWDGIDNTRSGHSSSTTTWEDLVGNYDLTQAEVGGTWEPNAILFNKTNFNGLYGDTLWTYSENATIEIVLAPNIANSTMTGAVFDRSDTTMSASQYDSRRVMVYSDNTIGFFGHSAYTYDNAAGTITDIRKLVATYSGFNVVKAFANNIQLSLSNKTHNFGFSGNPQIRVGSQNFSVNSYPFSGRIYAMRVYNRQLTDAEISQNFAYDNARFNLGVT